MTRRLAIAVLVVMLLPLPARADENLVERLAGSGGGEARATGMVLCNWGSDSAAGRYEVVRRGDSTMIAGPSLDLMITTSGTVMRRNGDWYAVDFTDRSEWWLSDRYTLGEAAATVRLGRPAHEYMVLESGQPRVRIVVDDATAIPLLTEVLDGTGAVFRAATVVEISEDAGEALPATPEPSSRRMVPVREASPNLPPSLAGYRLMNAYALEDGGVQGYYTDGLFAFSVFETARGATPSAFADATRFTAGDATYLRVVTPDAVWVYWASPDHSFVLVGDLPPDHLMTALEDLPAPGDRALLVRLWRRLFG